MTQKQIAGVFVGVALVAVLGIAVYLQFTKKTTSETASAPVVKSQDAVKKQPVPDNIDDITDSISAESAADTSALEDEVKGEANELDLDNSNINNLESSYDENNI